MLLLYIRPQVVDPTSMSDARFSLKKNVLYLVFPIHLGDQILLFH